MEKKNYDTIYEKILSAVLKVMYEMRKDSMSGKTEEFQTNFYDRVYEELRNNDIVDAPNKDDINKLYDDLDKLSQEPESE